MSMTCIGVGFCWVRRVIGGANPLSWNTEDNSNWELETSGNWELE